MTSAEHDTHQTCRRCTLRSRPCLAAGLGLASVALIVLGLATAFEATVLIIGCAVILCTAVALHEAGHLLVARRAGIAVSEYAVGFGPVLFAGDRGGTAYTLRAFPLGGFCHVVGTTPGDRLCEQHARSLPGVPMQTTRLRTRLGVLVGGVWANLACAWVLLLPVTAFIAAGSTDAPWWQVGLLAALATTVAVAIAPFAIYLAVFAYVLAIPAVGWTDDLGSVLSLPDSMATTMVDPQLSAMPWPVVVMLVAAAVHLSLGAVNALPVFPLDGFRVATTLVESARGSQLSAETSSIMAAASAAPLGVFVAGLFIKDVVGLVTG